MENRGALILAVLVLFPIVASAYDDTTAHPALTSEIIRLGSYTFSTEERQAILRGSVEEDEDPKYLRHFYDPVHNRGLEFGGHKYRSSKVWANSPDNEFRWERGIYEYAWGDKLKGLNILGHVLHLVEDASVPDHTRNDPHPPVLDLGSPYEHWTKQFEPGEFFAEVGSIKKKFEGLSEAFDSLAGHSNSNFFSKDTLVGFYDSPVVADKKIERLSDGVLYRFAYSELGFRLAYSTSRELGQINASLSISDPDNLILKDYWRLLSRAAIEHGIGVVDLFFQEVEKERQTKVLYEKYKPKEPFLKRASKDIKIFLGLEDFVLPAVALQPASLVEAVAAEPSTEVIPSVPTATKKVVLVEPINTPETEVAAREPEPETSPIILRLPEQTLPPLNIQPSLPADPLPVSSSPGFGGGGGGPAPAVQAQDSAPAVPAPISEPEPAESTPPEEPVIPPLYINEVMWAGSEWIELYNDSDGSIDLSMYTIDFGTASSTIVLSGGVAAKSYFLIESAENAVGGVAADLVLPLGEGIPDLGSVPIRLLFNSGDTSRIVDTTFSCANWCNRGSLGSFASMERISTSLPADQADSWMTNDNLISRRGVAVGAGPVYGTPGIKNSASYVRLPSSVSGATVRLLKSNSPYVARELTLAVQNGGVLEAEPGVIIKTRQTRIEAGTDGRISFVGTPEEQIVLTSLDDSEYGGNLNPDARATSGAWLGIKFEAPQATSTLEQVRVRYADTALTYSNQVPIDLSSVFLERSTAGIRGVEPPIVERFENVMFDSVQNRFIPGTLEAAIASST